MKHILQRSLFLLATLGAHVPAGAGETNERITVNMRDADIRSVAQWMSEQTGRQFILHSAVKGNITVVSREPVTREEAYQLFLAALQVNGISAVKGDNGIKLLPESSGRFAAPQVVTGERALQAGGGQMGTHVIKLQSVKGDQVATLVRPLVGPQGVVTSSPQGDAIVVTDYGENLQRIASLVRQVDQGGPLNIEVVPLQFGNAADVAKALQNLAGREAAGPDAGGPQPMSFGAEERTNSVLISGDPARRAQMRTLVHKLDRPVSGEGNTQVTYLRYADAKEVAEILKGLAESIQKDQKSPDAGAVRIQPAESSNAVVINAPPAMQASFKSVISQLDVRRAQVLVEALVVEVNDENARDLGISWITNPDYATDPDGGPVGLVNTLGRLKLADAVADGSLTAGTLSPGLSFGFYKGGELRAALRALATNTRTNILSTPTVVALDHQEANLLVGQNVPFKTGQAATAASGTDNPFTTIERKDIGVTLKITPHINQGDAITLEIEQSTENIAPAVTDASDIVTNKTEIKTRALIRDGEVLVIGGLIRDSQQNSASKVPLLGDIPGLGALFRSTGKDNTKANLMVFIHPVILKDEAQSTGATRARYQHMQQQQERLRESEHSVDFGKPAPVLPAFESLKEAP